MSIRNKISCATIARNTGYGSCVLHLKDIRGAILVPKGWKLTAAQMASAATVRAALQAAITAAQPERIYPISGFMGLTDNSEALVTETLGYGAQLIVRDGNYNWTFRYFDGGLCLSNALRSFNGLDYDVMFWDSNRTIFGTSIVEADGTISQGGVPQDMLYGLPWTANNGTTNIQYQIAFSHQPSYTNENISYVRVDWNPGDLMGLKNISFEHVSSAAGVITMQLLTGCAGANLYDQYSVEFADETLFTAVNADTGLPIAITSVVAGAATAKTFIFTLDSLDPNYPATAQGLIVFNTVSSAQLAAADIEGYEGLPITVERG